MVTGGNEHRVDVAAAEDFEHVAAFITIFVAVLLVGHPADNLTARFLHVGNRHKLDVGLLEKGSQILATARADANAAHDDPIARGDRPVLAQGGGGNDRRHAQGQCRGFQKVASRGIHG